MAGVFRSSAVHGFVRPTRESPKYRLDRITSDDDDACVHVCAVLECVCALLAGGPLSMRADWFYKYWYYTRAISFSVCV